MRKEDINVRDPFILFEDGKYYLSVAKQAALTSTFQTILKIGVSP